MAINQPPTESPRPCNLTTTFVTAFTSPSEKSSTSFAFTSCVGPVKSANAAGRERVAAGAFPTSKATLKKPPRRHLRLMTPSPPRNTRASAELTCKKEKAAPPPAPFPRLLPVRPRAIHDQVVAFKLPAKILMPLRSLRNTPRSSSL